MLAAVPVERVPVEGRRRPAGRYVRLTLSARAVKTVDVIGIEAAVARIRARGVKV